MMAPVHSDDYRRMLEKLREARTAAGLTQAQVAEKFGKRQNFVSKVESGERRIDPIELRLFAEAYGREVDWFLSAD